MNRIVVITGGTKGIGLETAKKFLKEGDKVVVASIDCDEVIKESMGILSQLGEVSFVKCNVADSSDCECAVNTVIEKYGRIDILANVAGIVGKRQSFLESEIEDIKKVLDVNLIGTIILSQMVAKEMIKQKFGVIVNVGSICGFMANSESVGYHASKGGVKMITQLMARQLSPFGIRVLSVAPGWVKTEMVDENTAEIGGLLHMKKRIIEPEEVANAIYLLSFPEASAINGTTVMVDDGYTSFKSLVRK